MTLEKHSGSINAEQETLKDNTGMKFLKGLALTLLGFLLFLSLSIFSTLFLLNSTLLNPNFITAELDSFEVSSMAETIISEQLPPEEYPEELRQAIVDTVTGLEPVVKEQVNAVIHSTYDYLLGKRDTPELAQMLGDTFLNSEFVIALMEELDIASLTEEIISEQTEEFPEEFRGALVDTVTRLEPRLKEQVAAAADPVFAYLLGESQSLDLTQTLRDTLLSSEFITALVEELDIATLAGEIISEQLPAEESPAEFSDALVDTITRLEPQLKEQVTAAADPIFTYLLGESQSLDLTQTLRDTLLSYDFVIALVDELDIASLAGELLSAQLADFISAAVPEELGSLVEGADDILVEALSDTLIKLEPWLKEQLIANADPILDYLLGESQSLSIALPTEPVIEILEETAKEALLESVPSLLQSLVEPLIDGLFQGLSALLPATFEIDESLLGTDIAFAETIAEAETSLTQARQEFALAIAEAEASLELTRQDIAMSIAEGERGLEEGRQYVGYFQLGYNLLIAFMLLLILGIVLIHRQVRGATRTLGITLLTFGAIELIGVFAARYFAGIELAQLPPLPAQVQTWLPQLLNSFLAPLQWLSIGLVAAGIALLVVSFIYKPGGEQFE
ncbi:hypothetical protein ACFLX7_02175 [Chloroflexota bacterium]